MSYKETINLPQTEFPMKASLPQQEPGRLLFWEELGIYQKLLQKNKSNKPFILHDGPPYANGTIHFGHILNKILKDIIVKYQASLGHYAPYIPGWDCHGLPIELGALKNLPGDAGPLAKRAACREFALNFVDKQREDFKRLGIFGHWDSPYLTLTNQYEADIAREFIKLYTEGYVYQGQKPVYWCTSCRTALAEAEVEYEDVESASIYVPFKLKDNDLGFGLPVYFVIWTTTPWTLSANLGLALGANYEYGAYQVGEKIYVVAKDLKDNFAKTIGAEALREVGCFLGDDLVAQKLIAEHPFIKREVRIVAGHHVTLESGTGVVHIAPGHGLDDYIIGQKEGLPILCPVDAGGHLMAGALEDARDSALREWEGKFVKQVNKLTIAYLHDHGLLLNPPDSKLKHSYPHCWRCKNAVIFRATEQWFCAMDHRELRSKSLQAITGQVHWVPSWGQDRIYGMISARPDWCLSRQRIWGVPIVVHFCAACQKPMLTKKIGEKICAVFSEKGADAWWDEACQLLPDDTQCECGSKNFLREQSILDVWFDSGVSHAAVLESREELSAPADLYLEGSDQHRGWFHSSLLTSMATRGRAPYKTVLTHGFVVDGQGRKYSKSAQNYIPPEKVLNERGAELLRLWVAAENYANDIRVSDEIIAGLSEVYRKIRNTCRFMLGALNDFDVTQHSIPFAQREEIDRLILQRVQNLVGKIDLAYQAYQFHTVHHSLNRFFTVDLSAFYLDILKDRLYCGRTDGMKRRSAQSSIHDILLTLVPLLSPILSFTAEEIWQNMPTASNLAPSVFLHDRVRDLSAWQDEKLSGKWQRIELIRDDVLQVLEVARKNKDIGGPLEACIHLSAEGELLGFLKSYAQEWSQIFITSQVEIHESLERCQLKSESLASLRVGWMKAKGQKCERCWNILESVGECQNHPTLCQRCVEALS